MVQRLGVDAKAFQDEWLRHHEGRQPIRWMLRESGLPWVRFHALPGSKRYAENEDERQTITSAQAPLAIAFLVRELLGGFAKDLPRKRRAWGRMLGEQS